MDQEDYVDEESNMRHAAGGVAAVGMYGAGGDTGCGPTGADALAEPGGVRTGSAAIGQEQLAEPAWMGAGAETV